MNIFQISKIYLPSYIRESILVENPEFEYINFNDNNDIDKFFEENPLSDELDKSILESKFKIEFFKYYFLYIRGGVYLDTYAMILRNLKQITEKYDFIGVESCMNSENLFLGFMYSKPKSKVTYDILKLIVDTFVKTEKMIEMKEIKSVLEKHKNILLMKEKRQNNKNDLVYIDTYYENDNIIRNYYTKKKPVPSKIEIPNKNNKKKILGLTLNVPNTVSNIFSCGLNQNTLYLGELFVKLGFEVYFIISEKIDDEKVLNTLLYENEFKFIYLEKIFRIDFDIIFFVSFSCDLLLHQLIRYNKTKCIYYNCGNVFMGNAEKILYNNGRDVAKYNKDFKELYDEIWVIPQHIKTGTHYLKTLYRTRVVSVPFVWSQKAIYYACLSNNVKKESDLLWSKRDYNKIAIFEPNMSIMKWCIPPLLVCENAYRIEKNIDHVYVNNTVKHNSFQREQFENIVKSLDLYEDKKITCEGRFNTLMFMKNYANIAVSFQMENPLNYLYLDLAWMGYPIIHNAHFAKDIGYYYEECNYTEGGLILHDIIKNHNFEEYIKVNRRNIDKFLVTNKDVQKKYKKLIYDLILFS